MRLQYYHGTRQRILISMEVIKIKSLDTSLEIKRASRFYHSTALIRRPAPGVSLNVEVTV